MKGLPFPTVDVCMKEFRMLSFTSFNDAERISDIGNLEPWCIVGN